MNDVQTFEKKQIYNEYTEFLVKLQQVINNLKIQSIAGKKIS